MSVALGQCADHGESQTPVGLFRINNQTGQFEPAGPEPREISFGVRIVQPVNVLKQQRFFDLAEKRPEFGRRIAVLDVPRLINMAPAQMIGIAPAVFDPIQILPELKYPDFGPGRSPRRQFASILQRGQKSVGD